MKPHHAVAPSEKRGTEKNFQIAVLLMYTVFMAPMQACFNFMIDGPITIVDQLIDVLFGLDIVVSFSSAYIQKDKIVVSRSLIASHYLRTWFFFDFIAVLPVQYLVQNRVNKLAKIPRLLRVLKLLRLLKLLRVARLQGMIRRLEAMYGIHVGLSRLGKMVFWVVVVNHILACLWYLIPTFDGDPEPDSWIVRHEIQNADFFQRYISSAYWVFSTLTTVGFGDITGYTQGEKIFSLIVMAMGVTWYAFVVSSMSSIMGSFDTHNATMRVQMLQMNAFMRDADLPIDLRQRLREHFEQVSTDKSNLYEADEILSDLPAQLRVEVLMFMYRDMISEINYLKGKTPQFAVRLVVKLNPLFVEAEGLIVEEGTHADEMYFLTSGLAHVMQNGSVIGEIKHGAHFGEAGCLTSEMRHASVIAVIRCELYTIIRNDLFELMFEYPDFANDLRQKALKHLTRDGTAAGIDPKEVLRKHTLIGTTGRRKSSFCQPPSFTPNRGAIPSNMNSFDTDLINKKLEQMEDRLNERLKSIRSKLNDCLAK